MMRDYIKSLVVEARIADVDQTTSAIALMLEGAIATAQVMHTPEAAHTAKATAKILLHSALEQRVSGTHS